MGKINSLVYFSMNNGILNFYKPEVGKIVGQLFMPNCQII
jgi:hypothetical protein